MLGCLDKKLKLQFRKRTLYVKVCQKCDFGGVIGDYRITKMPDPHQFCIRLHKDGTLLLDSWAARVLLTRL